MPVQDFNIYTANGYEGELVDSGPRVVQTGVLTSAKVGFGKAVSRDTSVERGVSVGSTASVYAITQREYNREADTRPTDGTDFFYKQADSVSLVRDGFIRLKVTGRAAVAGQLANVVTATGLFTGGSAGSGETATTNVVWEESGVVGETVKARIILAAV